MRQTKNTRAFISLVAVSIFVFSMMFAGSTATLPEEQMEILTPLDYSITQTGGSPPQDNGTDVWWYSAENSSSDEWSWDNKNWLFGPSPSFEVFHENGTLLTKDSYVEINDKVIITVTIPRGIFDNTGLGQVNLNGWYMSPDQDYFASFDINFDPQLLCT